MIVAANAISLWWYIYYTYVFDILLTMICLIYNLP